MNHWSEFLKARARAIHAFFAEGQTYTEIVRTLNLQDITHALAIHTATTPEPLPPTWRPIATCPRDGTLVLMFCPGSATRIATGRLLERDDGIFWTYANTSWSPEFWPNMLLPTHWQELPPEPTP